MSTHRHIDRICVAAIVCALLLTILFMNGKSLGLRSSGQALGYEDRLFDTSRVHTLDIVMDDWDGFLADCEDEQYRQCAVVIDGESIKNVGLRAKGNTSLSYVARSGSRRYSFKVEFDQFDPNKSYHGLDKLSLNNVIQDNTYLKDYLSYRMMDEFGVDAPLCSFVNIRVNGEEWGLYLAVEGVEDAFLRRNYGTSPGELYKPDNMSFGAGRGNGRNLRVEDINLSDFSIEKFRQQQAENPDPPAFGGWGFGSARGADVRLQYIDDDPESYPDLFGNAKTEITDKDKERLIASLKQLSSFEDIESVVDVDEVLRYFVTQSYSVNGDSYAGSMVHNYYLHERDGVLSMIPWDYNLAFGTFRSSLATYSVNEPIDDALNDRPMQGWIFSDETYTALYHRYYAEFLEKVDVQAIIDGAHDLIAPYVERDPTKFCTYEAFETAVAALKEFCALRTRSVAGQLDGSIPSTSRGQADARGSLVDAGDLRINDMGTMMMGGGFGAAAANGANAGGNRPGGADGRGARPEAGERPDIGEGPDAGKRPEMGGRPDAGGWPGMGELPGMGGIRDGGGSL